MCRSLFLGLILIAFLLTQLIFGLPDLRAQEDDSESSCVTCHTSAVKLIKITREIQKKSPPEEKSSLTKGEG